MKIQEEFNEHVQKIIDLRGKAVCLQSMRYIGLTKEEEAELKRLEATLPGFSDEEAAFYTEMIEQHKARKFTIEINLSRVQELNLTIRLSNPSFVRLCAGNMECL